MKPRLFGKLLRMKPSQLDVAGYRDGLKGVDPQFVKRWSPRSMSGGAFSGPIMTLGRLHVGRHLVLIYNRGDSYTRLKTMVTGRSSLAC